jgi:hypothetical protein
LFKKKPFDIFESMKKFLQKPLIKKILLYFIGFVVILLIFDNIIIPWYVSSPEVVVPDVKGLEESKAFSLLENSNLEPIISELLMMRNLAAVQSSYKDLVQEKLKRRRVYLFVRVNLVASQY